MKLNRNSNKLVSYSRSGDVFHYRWAARRCLRLIQPASNLESVVIEGSKERNKAGEYVIDLTEYYHDGSKKRIEYYQLKHTTVRHDDPFTLSGLKETIEGFSKRFKQHDKENTLAGVSFSIVTNRKIAESFKLNIEKFVTKGKVSKQFSLTLRNYTKLTGNKLIEFCSLLNLQDGEGDYNIQKEELRNEMNWLQPGTIDPAQVASIVVLVQDKILPDSNGIITKEEVLRPFGVTSEEQLFPAPPLFETIDNITVRDQYQELIDTIIKSDQPVIVNAEGGVGKSVFSQYLLSAIPRGSMGVAYDCFGSGEYRRRSKPRHRHRDALVQISNELASIGLCERMLVKDSTQETNIMRDFISRIKSSLNYLKQLNPRAQLFILIDAADNAEMAAQESSDNCFANEILREELPEDCRLILLCRPERAHLLKAPSNIPQLKLLPFSKEETFKNLIKWYSGTNEAEAYEFHRLTNGNPRVQMNAIAVGHTSVNELLSYLGTSGISVEKQIEQQLYKAVQKVENNLPFNYQNQVTKICTGLASLPPNIPLEVLSRASQVRIEDVKSFIADIGRALWLLDSSVQFRDEPTETWFKKTYTGSTDDFDAYIKILEPIASELTYVAEVLPQLYLQAGQYDKLIEIALSDRHLPLNNPIDTRNVLVFRLQFAFKAALKAGKYKDSIKLAIRAGEEVAGDQRQQDLFQSNIDLIPKLQDKLKVQEIAFKGRLRSSWEGSENIYTASLLSEIEEYQGEANSYLRSALNWIQIYFQESKKRKESRPNHRKGISHADILEIAFTQLNVGNANSCLEFLDSLRPKEFIFLVMKNLIKRLIDAGRFDDIDAILQKARSDKYHVVAIVSELEKVGSFAKAENLEKCLNELANPLKRIKRSRNYFNDDVTPSIISFLEACLRQKLNTKTILKVLDYYVPTIPTRSIGAMHDSNELVIFLKAQSIRNVFSVRRPIELEELVNKVFSDNDNKKKYKDNEEKEFKEVMGALIPWYNLRANVIFGEIGDLNLEAKKANDNSKKAYSGSYRAYDKIQYEITKVSSSILTYCSLHKPNIVRNYYDTYLKTETSFTVDLRISLLRTGHRAHHLDDFIDELENSTYEFIKGLKESRPEETSEHYLSLARAVLSGSKDDAAVYFEEAIGIVSKFGDEIIERWEALDSLGEISVGSASDQLAYRFIRCAELVGEYVYREKHWDRSGAVITCTKMSPQIGISALSRWRDREVGRFDYQFESLLIHLVESELIQPVEGWSLARIFSNQFSNLLISTCLTKENKEEIKQHLLEDVVEVLRKEGATSEQWQKLKLLTDQHKISISTLDYILEYYKKDNIEKSSLDSNDPTWERVKINPNRLDVIFKDVEFFKSNWLTVLLDRFNENLQQNDDQRFIRPIDFYVEIMNRIEANQSLNFIDELLNFERISYFEFQQVFFSLPASWSNKVSFKMKWPEIIKGLGKKYSQELVNHYAFHSLIRELKLDDSLIVELKKGIFQGLSIGQEFNSASAFFNYVRLAVTLVSSDDASDLLDFALSRFELHIEFNFADGPWSEWLNVSSDMNHNLAGLIWSALGSPHIETRWKACHVVKTLSDFNCKNLLDSLLVWVKLDQVGAFGGCKFHFYNLHARQYLLIALSRVSVDQPGLLKDYKDIFLNYALAEHHVIIQKYSADIALRIEKNFPQTYKRTEIKSLEQIGKSELKQILKGEKGYIDSYLHKFGKVDTSINYNFGWDFERYWYEPLGELFGISGKQIEELCSNLIANDEKLGKKTGIKNDPRVSQWNRSYGRETIHSHGSYPKADNWNFYLSYHSMLIVAAKLIQNMPLISSKENLQMDEPWDYWLSKHLLTRKDGMWLSDFRGPLPLERPEWIVKEFKYEEWRVNVQDQDFLNSTYSRIGSEVWLNIKGSWTERHNSKYETYSISTAFVSKNTSEALQKALQTCSNCHDYKIPDFQEDRVEINSGIFTLKGFIDNQDFQRGIDKLDPCAANLVYPPYTFGEPFINDLGLTSVDNGKTWRYGNGKVVLKCDTWSERMNSSDEEPGQSGIRLSASISILKRLCKKYDSNLIIEVNIRRGIDYKYQPKEHEYLNPFNKIYIFTEDGILKDTEQSIKLR
jgi:hypothetical protein